MDYEELHALEEDISAKVHNLMDELTKKLEPEMDAELRERMNSNFRFWRR